MTFAQMVAKLRLHQFPSDMFKGFSSFVFFCAFCSDVNKIQEGIGEKMCLFFQWFSTFLTGFIVGFFYGWKLTLVILSVSPLLAISGAVMGKVWHKF